MTTTHPSLLSPTHTQAYFPALTGVRAIAAYLVFCFHMRPFGTTGQNGGLQFWLDRLTAHGDAGVSIFFVLSGFLITIRYMNRIEPTRQWAIGYMQNRFARIYPVYFLITALTFVALWVHPLQTWYTWPVSSSLSDKLNILVLNLTLMRCFFQDLCFTGVPTAWSLTVEECFYVAAPFLLLSVKSRTWRLLLYPVVFLLTGILLVNSCSYFDHPYGLLASVPFMLRFTFFGRCTEFILGMGLGIWVIRKSIKPTVNQWVVTFLGVLGVCGCMLVMDVIAVSTSLLLQKTREWIVLLFFHIFLPSAVVMLFWGLLHEKSLLRKVLETNLFSLLGKSSYCFYLIHLGLPNDVLDKYVTRSPLIKFGVEVAFAILLYKLVEVPLQRWLKRDSMRDKQPTRQYYLLSGRRSVWQQGYFLSATSASTSTTFYTSANPVKSK
jgi:peptidoglycan/LPS O-acetylase OafA/YrhL